ncbi:DUF3048 domain-containing protein [Alkalihalobacillus oceani]|uniref:DUF3048 domain-containing protein n=1 Tax=Halalkalibacter oceani TaxID=1653776 RepID=UPI00203C27AE|nr:DUF3048 domain-containing protein [Halalkalibacter oceani]MCM3762045.1 DUF3048 domain-containing protein [Halalkalibacter oceani]
MKKSSSKWIAAVAALTMLAACQNDEPTVDIEEEQVEPVEDAGEAEASLPYTYPLTGVGTEEQLDRRVVGVTINNHPAARPQSGLVSADVVYEVLAEGEVTRFIALYHSQLPERVGPVRSARPYFIDLVNGYNGMLVIHGWSPEAEQLLNGGAADFLNGLSYDGTLFERSAERQAPHNSYITFEHILEGFESRNYELDGPVPSLDFYENEEIQLAGADGKAIEINYYDRNMVNYVFDEELGVYHRFNGEAQTVDHETDEPVSLANLFVVEAEHRTLDDVGRRAINLTSGGKGILFQSGIANEVDWENRDGQIIPVRDGVQVPLSPGQTWINIVPTLTSVTY